MKIQNGRQDGSLTTGIQSYSRERRDSDAQVKVVHVHSNQVYLYRDSYVHLAYNQPAVQYDHSYLHQASIHYQGHYIYGYHYSTNRKNQAHTKKH